MGRDMVRITGMNSGLDTEAIIKAYTSTHETRLKKAKDSLQINKWKQESWKEMNSKIYNFYSKTLSTNRLSTAYSRQKVTTSNGALSVIAGAGAANGVQTAQIKSTAAAAYLTGSKLTAMSDSDSLTEKLGIDEGSVIEYSDNKGRTQKIQIGGEATEDGVKVVNSMKDLTSALRNAGINANFDAGNGRLFLSAKSTGVETDFKLSGDNEALAKLGIATKEQIATLADADSYKAATKIDGSNAKLILNGAEFESNTNSFSINGSTYNINYMPTNSDENITVNTQTDYDAVYDVVKNMLKEYNSLMEELSKAYNAESSKGYNPLSDEQKEEMSEKEIEDWENKIKGALLRKDDTVFDVMNALTNSVSGGLDIGGKKLYLSDFGISTQGYFAAEENQRYALHIDGDTDDEVSAGNADKLKSMIASDPETVTKFFAKLADTMYKDLYSKMGTSSLSSIYKVYNDKELKSEQTEWEKKVSSLEDALSDAEDKYYSKFAVMEKTLAKINSNQSSMGSFFG